MFFYLRLNTFLSGLHLYSSPSLINFLFGVFVPFLGEDWEFSPEVQE